METRQLRTFVTIVEAEGFTRAGRRLGLSQSAISQQVHVLEQQVGTALLARRGTSVRLTVAGEVLLEYARQILGKVDEAQRMLAELDETGNGVFRVGAGGAVCEHILPRLVRDLREQFPKLEIQVRSGRMPQTVELLLAGELDLGIVSLPVSAPKLRCVDVGCDELLAVVARSHPWAGRKRVQPEDFTRVALLAFERDGRRFRQIEQTLLEAGVFPRVTMDLDHMGAVVAMAREGLGVALLPRWAVVRDLETGDLVGLPIGKQGLGRKWGLAYLEESGRTRALKVFARLAAERLPKLFAA